MEKHIFIQGMQPQSWKKGEKMCCGKSGGRFCQTAMWCVSLFFFFFLLLRRSLWYVQGQRAEWAAHMDARWEERKNYISLHFFFFFTTKFWTPLVLLQLDLTNTQCLYNWYESTKGLMRRSRVVSLIPIGPWSTQSKSLIGCKEH